MKPKETRTCQQPQSAAGSSRIHVSPGSRKNSLTSTDLRSTGDGQFTIEDISHHDTGYDGDVEVVRPYQYEDAGQTDDSTKSFSPSIPPKRLRSDELWTTGLIEWMSSLRCDPDSETLQRRGRKRKARSFGEPQRKGVAPRSRNLDAESPANRRSNCRPKKAKTQGSKSEEDESSMSEIVPIDKPDDDVSDINNTGEKESIIAQPDTMDVD